MSAKRQPPSPYPSLYPKSSPALWTAMRYSSLSRVVVSGFLLLLFFGGDVNTFFETAAQRGNFLLVSGAYCMIAVLFVPLLARFRRAYVWHLLAHVAADLLALTLMIHFTGGLRTGLGVLAVVSVAGGAVLATRRLALAFAAAASLLLLGEAGFRVLGQEAIDVTAFYSAGLIGAACFAAAYGVNWLANRLALEERLAMQRGEELRRQLAITQLVIAELQQGVLVVGRDGRVQTLNRVALSLLGPLTVDSQSLLDPHLDDAWAQLGRVFREWLGWSANAPRPEAMELTLMSLSATGQAPIPQAKVKLRFLSAQAGLGAKFAPEAVGDDVVLVIEDLRALEERAQQLKLASMGRLSASIAHEIRNPLGAIRHANSLLAEQLTAPPMQRLAGIVETNTVRINRIVEDVLSISRRDAPNQEAIDLAVYLPAFLDEFVTIVGGDPKRLNWALKCDALLQFDANHLRQVLVNILSNALRYASMEPAAVSIHWIRNQDDRLELVIADDGPGLAPEVLQLVFEPFYTTEARGTGLGLYLARELCGANGALLRYERGSQQDRYRGAFVIEMSARRREAVNVDQYEQGLVRP